MQSINELISGASVILDNGFDLQAFLNWKQTSFRTLRTHLGPGHYYTLNFRRMTDPNEQGVLAGGGILLAAKELIHSSDTSFKQNQN
jgi:hypothetical protein